MSYDKYGLYEQDGEEENYANDLEIQRQVELASSEEDIRDMLYKDITSDGMDKFLKTVDDKADSILKITIDTHKRLLKEYLVEMGDLPKTLQWLSAYVRENKELYRENHYECIERTNKKLNKDK